MSGTKFMSYSDIITEKEIELSLINDTCYRW